MQCLNRTWIHDSYFSLRGPTLAYSIADHRREGDVQIPKLLQELNLTVRQPYIRRPSCPTSNLTSTAAQRKDWSTSRGLRELNSVPLRFECYPLFYDPLISLQLLSLLLSILMTVRDLKLLTLTWNNKRLKSKGLQPSFVVACLFLVLVYLASMAHGSRPSDPYANCSTSPTELRTVPSQQQDRSSKT